ncbi:MAG: tetratricopeptide repeat protein, partial [Tepidisphaeraceae bacterium]
MEAMAAGRAASRSRIHQLWQLPLLLASLGLFGYAAYLFIDPKPGLSIDQKIVVARTFLKQERAEAAIEQLNKILATEKLDPEHQAKVHLALAESLEVGQKQKRINVPANHERIIEQTRLAQGAGAKPDAPMYRRMAESFEALGRKSEALDHYRQAAALDPSKSLRLQRKVIDLQLAVDDPFAAEVSLEAYLRATEITGSERSWALGERAQILIDRGKFVEGRTLLDEALKLSVDPVAQGEVNYRLGYAAWKMGDVDEAERYLRVARDQLRVQHPLDADACHALGRIYQEKNDPAQAISFYQIVLVSHPDAKVAPLSRLGRGVCRIMQGEDDPGLTDLHDLVNQILAKSSYNRYREPALNGLRQGSQLLTAKGNLQGALELLAYEQQLQPLPPPGFFGRLAEVYEKRADQVEKTIPDADNAEKIRRGQMVRELRTKAGDAFVGWSNALTLSDDKGYGDALWRGIDLYDRAANVQSVIAALELFVAERPDDSLAPDALLRLGRAYQAAGLFDKAIAAFQRNQFRYAKSLAASKSAVPLAQAYIAKGPDAYGKAETVLMAVVDNNPTITPQ